MTENKKTALQITPVERFKYLMFKEFTSLGTHKCVDILPMLIVKYNKEYTTIP